MELDSVLMTLLMGVVIGAAASLAAKYSSGETFDPRKMLAAVIMGIISGLTVVQALEGGIITESNLITTILAILGASFVMSKSINTVSTLKKSS